VRFDGDSFLDEDWSVYEVRSYVTPEGRDVYVDWHRRLRDTKVKLAADRRLKRIEHGNFGDHKYLSDGVWELRIDVGPGYRIYYGLLGQTIVLLLCAGDKASQITDIARAVVHLKRVRDKIMSQTRSIDESMAEIFRDDPNYAVELLNDVLEDGEPYELLIMLRQLTKAFGGVQAVAERAEVNPTQLYRTLSAEGNPSLSTLTAVLKAVGLRLAIQPIKAA